ncbi:hypothetical protein [Streptomyces sp. NPDC050560]|uniref:hypothetical protein n=1 Tax=Streptomyces sp. NPDC050560 TaxID=3365630 RepID=UPI0037AEE89B
MDIKVRNVGGQPAVLRRLVVEVVEAGLFRQEPLHPDMRTGAGMPVSGRYDVRLPPSYEAAGHRQAVPLDQVVPPSDTDRFLARLGADREPGDLVYLLRFEVVHDAAERRVTSSPVAVGVPVEDEIVRVGCAREAVERFWSEVEEIRSGVDREMAARGLPVPDWRAHPPRRRGELPRVLAAVDGGVPGDDGGIVTDGEHVQVNEAFWEPERAVEEYLREAEEQCRALVGLVARAEEAPDSLRRSARLAAEELAQLSALRSRPSR